jgi:hypothetical protein
MPIRASERERYPADWKAISERIRARSGGRCEFCGVPNYELGAWFGGKWYRGLPKGSGPQDNPRHGEIFPTEHGTWTRLRRIVLTVAHLDHTPENCADDNLRALCQRCHLTYDAKHHALTRRFNQRRAAGCADLFDADSLNSKGGA